MARAARLLRRSARRPVPIRAVVQADGRSSISTGRLSIHQIIRQGRAIKSVRKQASEMPGSETRALFGEAKRLKGFITDGESVPVAFFNCERRHSWEGAI